MLLGVNMATTCSLSAYPCMQLYAWHSVHICVTRLWHGCLWFHLWWAGECVLWEQFCCCLVLYLFLVTLLEVFTPGYFAFRMERCKTLKCFDGPG
jgi:hypothetical protein